MIQLQTQIINEKIHLQLRPSKMCRVHSDA